MMERQFLPPLKVTLFQGPSGLWHLQQMKPSFGEPITWYGGTPEEVCQAASKLLKEVERKKK